MSVVFRIDSITNTFHRMVHRSEELPEWRVDQDFSVDHLLSSEYHPEWWDQRKNEVRSRSLSSFQVIIHKCVLLSNQKCRMMWVKQVEYPRLRASSNYLLDRSNLNSWMRSSGTSLRSDDLPLYLVSIEMKHWLLFAMNYSLDRISPHCHCWSLRSLSIVRTSRLFVTSNWWISTRPWTLIRHSITTGSSINCTPFCWWSTIASLKYHRRWANASFPSFDISFMIWFLKSTRINYLVMTWTIKTSTIKWMCKAEEEYVDD